MRASLRFGHMSLQGAQRAMQAMFEMKKLDLNALRKAYAGA
jgi:hypothetical protein